MAPFGFYFFVRNVFALTELTIKLGLSFNGGIIKNQRVVKGNLSEIPA
jgi:hypothetical protein